MHFANELRKNVKHFTIFVAKINSKHLFDVFCEKFGKFLKDFFKLYFEAVWKR